MNKFKEKVSTLNTNSKSTIGKIEKIERAGSLYKNGLITKDEFEKIKKELL
ncbi:SHOCT domain-containing protein [Salmonella enterica]|uniref:SHOCT domain-containing protein n=1 Tax=Salmonella enterica TaxID=28901 RepID=UPI003D2BBD6F